jgi:serine/threonine-protein kinase HipA
VADTAFVFVYLPDQLDPTVAGRFDLTTAGGTSVGEFVYGASYLANTAALPLDPIALPLREQLFRTTLNSGFFGVFRDAIPDDWGRHVASRLYGKQVQNLFDYLWLRTADRMGALAFGRTPGAPVDEKSMLSWEGVHDTEYLEAIQKLDRDVPLTPAEREVAMGFGAGTTAGGARPKFTIAKDGAVWLAKLNRQSDRFNEVRVEAGMLDLAEECGISVPERELHHIHSQDVLLVKRFDREVTERGVLRHRMVSAATVFQADEAAAQYAFTGSYPRFARELSRWTIDGDAERRNLFRRIAFNALTTSKDDHERNHALVAKGPHFRLSPAFDLVPKLEGTRRHYLALVIGDYGALAIRENLLSSSEIFRLTRAQANDVIDDVQQTVRAHWRAKLKARDVPDSDLEKIAGCFDPESFEDPAPQGAVL